MAGTNRSLDNLDSTDLLSTFRSLRWDLPTQRQKRQPPISQEAWESHRSMIYALYIEQNKTLRELTAALTGTDFAPSKRQILSQLKRWNMRKFEPCNGRKHLEVPDSALGQAEENDQKAVQTPQRPEAISVESHLMHSFNHSLDTVELTTSLDFESVNFTDWQLSLTEFYTFDTGVMYSESNQQFSNSMHGPLRGETPMTRTQEPPPVEHREGLTDNHNCERVVIDLTRDDFDTASDDGGKGAQDSAQADGETTQQHFLFATSIKPRPSVPFN